MAAVIVNEWETAFFGRRIGRLLLNNAPNRPLADALFADFALVAAKIKASETAQLQDLQCHQFQWVEGELQLALPLPAQSCQALAVATPNDLPALHALFGNAFPHSRFRTPYFSVTENQRFYRRWITNAVYGRFDDVCLIKRLNGHIVGGVSVRLIGDHAEIGLLAVAADQQGKGIGGEILRGAQHWAKQQGAATLAVRTQSANLAAIRLYQKAGAVPQDLHYWLYRNAHSI